MRMINVSYQDEKGFSLEMTLPDDGTWDEQLQAFINFLRGIGYVIPSEVDLV